MASKCSFNASRFGSQPYTAQNNSASEEKPESQKVKNDNKVIDDNVDEKINNHEILKSMTPYEKLYTKLSAEKRKHEEDYEPIKKKWLKSVEEQNQLLAELKAMQNKILAINNSIHELVVLQHPPTRFISNGDEYYSSEGKYIKLDVEIQKFVVSTNASSWMNSTIDNIKK
jgi:hypothetical protein